MILKNSSKLKKIDENLMKSKHFVSKVIDSTSREKTRGQCARVSMLDIRLTDRLTDICNSRVAFTTEKFEKTYLCAKTSKNAMASEYLIRQV